VRHAVRLTSAAASDQTRFTAPAGLPLEKLAAALRIDADRVREVRSGTYVVEATASPELVADLAIWLRDEGIHIGELQAGRRSLEEVFLRLTGEGRS